MNAPTLLIGLGGKGCDIVERVSQMVTEEQRNNIAFAAFDTDINELRCIQERNPFIKIIQTSTKQAVGEYLNIDTHARDTWFPVNAILNGKALSEGAGQVRAISRLALETAIRADKLEPLHEAIQSLYKVEEDKPEQAIRVIIVSSLAGGTGSGLILPVALYVRNYLKTHFRQSANITRGFFILPEVFYEVIKRQTERNNLKANAYATLRELDAFLMKGDNTLDSRYAKSVRIQFPRVASAGYEEYDVSPYDFCFLFDAQNAEGAKLNSFEQYLDHAANCIYAQSIGPMNKRSNSSEDNTIRKLAKEKGRNRYAGAGVSMLIYPFEDIKSLIALKWAKECVSNLWLKYDNQYKELRRENQKNLEDGIVTELQPLSSYYATQIFTDAEHGDAFAKAIHKATGVYKNGVTRVTDRWAAYVTCLLNKVKSDIKKGTPTLTRKYEDAKDQITHLGTEWKKYPSAYTAELEYHLLAEEYVSETSQTIAYALFKGSSSSMSSLDKDYRLENYLMSSDGNFIHPNAIRYLLIKIKEQMKKHYDTIVNARDKNKKFFDDFEKDTFDDTETEQREETAEDLAKKKVSIFTTWSKHPNGEQNEIKDKLSEFLDKAEEYQVQCAQAYVLKQGMAYVENIIKSFELFFSSFENKVNSLDKCINDIYKKYSARKGNTVRYVCASEECFDDFCKNMVFTGSAITIDSKLSQSIYNKILEHSLIKDKQNNNRFFSELFDDGIIGYFKNLVMMNHGDELDVDIIAALEKEFYLLYGNDQDDIDQLAEQYVRKIIRDTRKLSCPFIEAPLGESQDPIDACTFNCSLTPEKGDDSSRAELIKNELMNYGGVPDEDIPKYNIMFYKSYYGLRANDLSKFAPPEKSATYNRSSGEYFKAYYELVQSIHPETHRSRGISPHIDRWWHIITKMPDLDDDNQKMQEYNNYAAFFWAIMRRYIDLYDEGSNVRIYKPNMTRLKMNDDTLIVSNGTECDKFYEVLDAIAIYPELVQRILSDVETRTIDDLNDGSPLEEGILFSSLRTFKIAEPGIGADNLPAASIFDIPMLMKKSATPDLYYEADVIEMLKVELEEIKKYLSKFCTAKELPEVMGKLIVEQFNKHLESVALESKIHPSIYRESLFVKTCDTIVTALSELGLKKEANKIQEKVDSLR